MKITILGDPIPKARARHFQKGNRMMTYDPQHEEKNHVRYQFIQAMRKAYDSEDKQISMEASHLTYGKLFHLSITFYMPTNESDSEGQKNAKLWGLEPCNKKPDCSNMYKFYEDAANEVLYPDDSMIVSGDFKKLYDKNPRTELNIMSKKELSLNEKAAGILKVFGPDKLKEFLVDVLLLTRIHPQEVDEVDRDDRSLWLSSAACLLSDFAIKYAEPLKKIRKYDGVIEEVTNAQLGLIDIDNGMYNVGKPRC